MQNRLETVNLCSRNRNLRLFKLSLCAQIALGALTALCSPASTAAQLNVCNNTKVEIAVTFGHMSTIAYGPTELMVKGFYAIGANSCSIIDANSVLLKDTFLFAWEPNNPKANWSGNTTDYQFCIPDDHKTNFEYHDNEARPPCGAGRLQEGFMWVANGAMGFFTENLNDSPAAAPVAKPAPSSAAPAPMAGSSLTSPNAAARKPAAAVLSTPSAPTGNAVLSVTSGLTGQPNPLAGHTYVLMNQSYEAMLAGAGIQAPAGVSPVKGYLAACAHSQPACQAGVTATNASTVSGTKADASGRAQLPGVPPGTYYFFCLGTYNNQLFKWDFQIQLKSGANSVTLDQHNAVAVN